MYPHKLWTLGTPATTPSVFIGLSRLKKANATPVARSVASRGLKIKENNEGIIK